MGTLEVEAEDDLAVRPAHVPASRVIDFNVHQAIPGGRSVHELWRDTLAKADAPVMWTPHNGGHWVTFDPELCAEVLSDSERFSSRVVIVPRDPIGETYSNFIPLSLDPPRHAPFRKILNDNLGPKPLKEMKGPVRELTIELIEGFRANGRCNFVHEFAEQLPVRIFLRLCGLPEADLPRLKTLADQFTRPDGSLTFEEVEKRFRDYIGPIIKERRATPGDDMISRMVNAPVNGRELTDLEAQNLCIQALVGGLDTVVNLLAYVMSYLASDDALQRQLAADPSLIERAVPEFLRRFPVVSDSREVRVDCEFGGVSLKAGDMIMASTIPMAMSDEVADDPMAFRVDRTGREYTLFGRGVHHCPGAHLARIELKIVLEEWLARIPRFRLAGDALSYTSGIVSTVDPFELEWDV